MTHDLTPLRLPVRTASGQKLGNVVDISIDPAMQAVTAYHVKLSRMLPDVVQTPLLIRPSQVIEITQNEMVVEDSVARQANARPAPLATA